MCAQLPDRRAIVLADIGVGELKGARAENGLVRAFQGATGATVYGQLIAGALWPVLLKERDGASKQWVRGVWAWPAWSRIFCAHLDPIVMDGRAQFARAYAFVTKVD